MKSLTTDELLPLENDDFWMVVHGDSMTGDGILNGDAVWLRTVEEVEDGEIHVVWVGKDRRCAIKRVFREDSNLRLRSSNPVYQDVWVAVDEVRSLALLKGVVRSLDPEKPLVRRL